MESEETRPLLSPTSLTSSRRQSARLAVVTDEVDGAHIVHRGSVYSCMVLMPPLSRRAHGHYCTAEVGLAFFLFVLAIVLQTVLSGLAGVHIFEQQALAQASLYTVIQEDVNWSFQEDIVARIEEEFQAGFLPRKGDQRANSSRKEGRRPPPCCGGVECAGQGMKCCPRRAKVDYELPAVEHAPESPEASFLAAAAAKPGGSSSSSGSGGAGASRGRKSSENLAVEQAVCLDTPKGLSCTPPTSRLLELWDRLDANGDGIWTIEEARADEANVGCIVGVGLDDVLQSACRGLVRDRAETAFLSGRQPPELPFEVHHGLALPWAYFDWWRGLAALCISTDVSLCSQMLHHGVFNGLLNPNNTGRGGVRDLDSALSYCQRLIAPGGVCDAALPGSYVMYRSRLHETCGAPTYAAGERYVNPYHAHDIIGTTSVSFENLSVYTNVHSTEFLFFLFLVLILWYVNLVDELKDILSLWDFIWGFPTDDGLPFVTPEMSKRLKKVRQAIGERAAVVRDKLGEKASKMASRVRRALSKEEVAGSSEAAAATSDEAEMVASDSSTDDDVGVYSQTPRSVEITSIDWLHKSVCVAMAITRTFVLVYLAWAGTEFMLMNMNYVDLLLNSLAIAFIFDLDEFLYIFLVPENVKERLDSIKPLKFLTSLPHGACTRVLFQKHFWGLVIIPLIAGAYVLHHDWTRTYPTLESLQCACLRVGERCRAAEYFRDEWWTDYWQRTASLSAT